MFYAHGQGIVHRDLKPANVLLTTTGNPRITDFGLAKRLWTDEETVEASMTETGQVLGTAGYMSPEQAGGLTRLVGPPADIYALGAILYALLTTRAPFIGEAAAETIRQVIHNEPIAPRRLNGSIPRDLETICLKCLAKEPYRRYGTAQLLADDLQRFLERRPVLARPVDRPARVWRWCRRNPVVAVWLATIATILWLGIVGAINFGPGLHMKELKASTFVSEQVMLRYSAVARTEVAEQSLYLADLRLAGDATERREFGSVRSILSGHVPELDRPDRRGWEWYYLLSLSQRRATTLYGHTGDVIAVAWNPAGNVLASADTHGVVRLWSLQRRDFVAVIEMGSSARALAWNADGQRLAVGLDGTIAICDVDRKAIVQSISGVTGAVACLAWHSEKPWLAWGDDARAVTVRDLQQNKNIWTSPKGGEIQKVAWRPGHLHLAITNSNHTAEVWDIQENQILASFTRNDGGYFGASWNSTGSILASSTSYFDYTLALLDLGSRTTQSLGGHVSHVSATAWSPNDQQVATCSLDRTIRVWNVEQGKLSEVLDGHSQGVNDISWSSIGTLLASAGSDARVVVWELGLEPDMPFELPGEKGIDKGLVRRLEWAPDSNQLATIGWDSRGRIWNFDTRMELPQLLGDIVIGTNTICWDPQGKYIVTDDRVDGVDAIQVWDATTLARINTIMGMPKHTEHVRWSPNGEYLAVTGENAVDIVDPMSGHKFHHIAVGNVRVCEADFSPDSKELAFAGFSKTVTIINVESGVKVREFEDSRAINDTLSWSPDGLYIATGDRQGHIHIYSAQTGQLLHQMNGHRGTVNGVRWSPDSARLTSVSHDGTMRLWDVRRGIEVLSLPGNVGVLWSVAWSPNGERIVACSNNGNVLVWDATAGYETANRNVIPWWLANSPSGESHLVLDPAVETQSPTGQRWHRYVTNFDTRVDLSSVSASNQNGLALTWVHSPFEQRALLRLGHNAPLELELNGQQVYQGKGQAKARADQVDQEVFFQPGWNQVVCYFAHGGATAREFYLRVANVDPTHPARGLRFAHDRRARQPLPGATDKYRMKDEYRDSLEWFIADTLLSFGCTIEIEGKSVRDRKELPLRRFDVEGLICPESFVNTPFLTDWIANFKTLRRIKLSVNRPDAKFFKQLGTLPLIEEVDLSGSNLTNQSTTLLHGLGNVRSLNVSDTSITARGVAELQAGLNSVKILWNSRENDRALATRLLAKNATLGVRIGRNELQIHPQSPLPTVPFRIVSITAEEKVGLTTEDFAGAEKLDTLESIDLTHTRLDDDVLEKFKGLTKLVYLLCGDTTMTGKPLATFQTMPDVYTVAFGGSLANESLVHFDKFPNAELLFIGWTDIDDAGLEKLPDLIEVRQINLDHTKIQGPGLATLRRFEYLQNLDLSETLLTDDGLRHLPVLPNLTELNLRDLPLTDKSIAHLADRKGLKKMDLSRTAFTADGISRLRSSLPNCAITWTSANPSLP